MAKDTEKQIIRAFLDYYFNTRKSQFSKNEISQYKELVKLGILYEIDTEREILELEQNSIKLQDIVLAIATEKLNNQLPKNIPEAFKFVDEFEETLKKEYNCERIINSFNHIIKGFKGFTLYVLYQNGLDIKSFLLSLSKENREKHLFSFERSFFDFLPNSDYSEKEIFEIFNKLDNKYAEHDIIMFLRNSFKQNLSFGNTLLTYALENDIKERFVSDLLIGAYNSGDLTAIDKAISLKDKNYSECLFILGRLNFQNEIDIEKAYNQIGDIEIKDVDIAHQQSYLIQNIVENKKTTEAILKQSFIFYLEFLNNGTDEIRNSVFHDISMLNGFESEKYGLLHLYLSKTGNFAVIRHFFYHFSEPVYIFDIMMRLFDKDRNHNFPMDLFENGISEFWNKNHIKTEECILNLFKQYSFLGILGVKVILSSHFGIYHVDLLKLDKVEYQLNAINNICKYPHSFDKLLPLILPLRNSKLRGVREHIQNSLAQIVFNSYHETIYKEIEISIGKTKRDKEFLNPIKKALEDYYKLKELKESINDLNPYENERDLMDLYYRLEHEAHAKMMNEVNAGKGTFMEMVKTNIIVRGNSFKFDDKEPTPMSLIKSSMLIDSSSYLNPDLYNHNLNITE
ncbi:hypothetical protein [Chryseobacterium rhizosphaerae]|uniref:hypothetical protein n=1 Tax=Chryseobacterium rhizosphaerae TaxID=395937 RepID=UPI002359B5C1|nr:hypothetical protein [Chryseobacterium rhizosphaerae]MDC8099131.1 hypothetical protein [Chryseobacterium rhizosphaerae]